jgi:hypothetical protein
MTEATARDLLEVEALEIATELRLRQADLAEGRVPTGMTRALFPHELAAQTNFAAIEQELDELVEVITRRLEQDRALYLTMLEADLRARKSTADVGLRILELDGASGWMGVQGGGDLELDAIDAHRNTLIAGAEAGMDRVRAEAKAQGVRVAARPKLSTDDLEKIDVHAKRLASAPNVDLIRAVREEATIRLATGSVDDYVDALVARAEGLSRAGLEDYAKGASTTTYGIGRNLGAKTATEVPVRIYASSVLDANTCPACFAIDGKEYETEAESLADFPAGGYVNCDGGLRCRCTRVFVWTDEAPPTRRSPGDTEPPGPGEPGGPPLPGLEPATPPAPRPRGGAPAGQVFEPAGPKVSGAMNTGNAKMQKKNRPKADKTLASIDEVHGDGNLPELPIQTNNRIKAFGHYRFLYTGKADSIAIRYSEGNPHPGLTLAHEVGHFLDHKGLDDSLRWATSDAGFFGGPISQEADDYLLKEWAEAIRGSKALERLTDIAQGANVVGPDGKEYKPSRSHVRYLLRADELWARSYAQYIATRSSDASLKAELVEYLEKHNAYSSQWTDEDFAPIAEAIDRLFERLGWRQPAQ